MNTVNSVEEYVAAQPAPVRRLLERVRATIRKAVPGAEESISYRIPTYKLHGRPVLYFAGFKEHYSIYPSTKPMLAAFKDDLAPYECSGKGTIRFSLSKPVPVRLIARLAKFRAEEVIAATTKAGGRPSRPPGNSRISKR